VVTVSERVDILYASRTDRGRLREINEDSVHAESFRTGGGDKAQDWLLLAIADGVGGHQRGEWASRKAVGVLARELPRLHKRMEPKEALEAACKAANESTWRDASSSGLNGAATTLVVALLDPHNLWWANVGDSRAYLVREGLAEQLTEDHSWVEEEVRAGRMTPEEARSSDRRHVITRSVGFTDSVEVDVGGPVRLLAGQRLVLCSDGLYDLVADDEICAAADSMTPLDAATRLVDLANERGGPDNISVIVCSIDGAAASARPAVPRETVQQEAASPAPWPLLLGLALFLAVVAAAAVLVLAT